MDKNTGDIKYCQMPFEGITSFTVDYVRIVWHEHLSLHQQKTWELSHVLVGKGTRLTGGVAEAFSAGEVVLIPPGLPHTWLYDESVSNENGEIENITVVFSDSLLTYLAKAFPELETVVSEIQNNKVAISFGGDALQQLQQLTAAMARQSKIEQISSLIKLFMLLASQEKSVIAGYPLVDDKKERKLQQIYWYVMNHFRQDITLDEIAQFVNMGKSSFCTFFRRMTGQTFFTYLTGYRIESSCQMLTETDKPIADVCFESGFRDMPHYNRVFKKLKKVTPTHYRKSYRKRNTPPVA
ncbi:MAG: AraC family transcriptional regulator [Tannerellaceae bacterium]|jgi:AraC-like DNA-binding protein|nr:AraC family transcriptional regulator [Tannerellaceae bacterium]